jgi:hypothetical protein
VTYRDLIQGALQDLQIVAAGDTLSADDAQLGLDRLNDWIDALALEGLTMPQLVGTTWPLLPGIEKYLVGPTVLPPGIQIPKPVSPQAIANIGYYDTTLTPTQIILLGGVITDQSIVARTAGAFPSAVPLSFYYDPTPGPIGELHVFPTLTGTTLRLVLYAPGLLGQVQLTDLVALPAGYRRFVRSNLTVELAAAFEKPVPPAILRIATDSMMRVKTANLRISDLGFDPTIPGGSGHGYDIRTDQ